MTTSPDNGTPTATRRIRIAELPSLTDQELGTSKRIRITQEQVNAFADATGDHQWIHVDPERAKDGPFGTTIAHGYLTLSLTVPLFWDLLDVDDAAQIINYGLNKVRFPAPVPVGSEVSASARVVAVDAVTGGWQLTVALTFNAEGVDRPVCVAEMIMRYLGDVD
ncbi:MaoC family dehydratase [Gordonia sp. (in: high G+C Gram-positive bacteria)]|uniref:MaoC family dehydratase n=1 Tax=Gordonia sp. (in: high G+C Gram-positive bacteria) TaxID=84139 RepID=UPI0025B8C42A|nr:MaoC family dehydratase [Gordonia sp. (in: high G+C Gram-positive bacteria)]